MSEYNLKKTQKEVDEVKIVMENNIHQMIDQNIRQANELSTKTEDLSSSAKEFEKNSKKLSRYMWLKKWKTNLLFGGIVLVVLLLIVGPIIAPLL